MKPIREKCEKLHARPKAYPFAHAKLLQEAHDVIQARLSKRYSAGDADVAMESPTS